VFSDVTKVTSLVTNIASQNTIYRLNDGIK